MKHLWCWFVGFLMALVDVSREQYETERIGRLRAQLMEEMKYGKD